MTRAVLLVPVDLDRDRLAVLNGWCERQGYAIVGAATTLVGAAQMLADNEADIIVADSRRKLGARIEVVSQAIAVRAALAEAAKARPRRLRRSR